MPGRKPGQKSPKSVESITHEDAKRKNIPTAELESVMCKDQKSPVQVACERRNRDRAHSRFVAFFCGKTFPFSEKKLFLLAGSTSFVERLWRTVKYEDIYLKDYHSVRDCIAGLKTYFAFYNHQRPHSSLGGATPAEVYFR